MILETCKIIVRLLVLNIVFWTMRQVEDWLSWIPTHLEKMLTPGGQGRVDLYVEIAKEVQKPEFNKNSWFCRGFAEITPRPREILEISLGPSALGKFPKFPSGSGWFLSESPPKSGISVKYFLRRTSAGKKIYMNIFSEGRQQEKLDYLSTSEKNNLKLL